jgi:hypothetical protein
MGTSLGQKAPTAERLVSAGIVGQLASAHRCAGGVDPRWLTRKRALELGAPLACKRKEAKPQMRRSHLQFVNEQRSKRKSGGMKMSAAEFRAEFDVLHMQYTAGAHIDRRVEHTPIEHIRPSYADEIGSTLWHLNDESWPITPAAASRVLDRCVPPEINKHGPVAQGLTQRLADFRSRFLDKCFIGDSGACKVRPCVILVCVDALVGGDYACIRAAHVVRHAYVCFHICTCAVRVCSCVSVCE